MELNYSLRFPVLRQICCFLMVSIDNLVMTVHTVMCSVGTSKSTDVNNQSFVHCSQVIFTHPASGINRLQLANTRLKKGECVSS
jgi:hypothetical protein